MSKICARDMSIIKFKAVWFSISGVLVVASIVLLVMFGLRLGIDFVGGSLLEVKYDTYTPEVADVRSALAESGFGEGVVQPVDEHGLLVRQPTLTEDEHQALLSVLEAFGTLEEERFDSIGPVVGQELRRKSVWALVSIFAAIVAYVAFAFRKSSHLVKLEVRHYYCCCGPTRHCDSAWRIRTFGTGMAWMSVRHLWRLYSLFLDTRLTIRL